MQSHHSIDEVLRGLQEEGIEWARWRGHGQGCETVLFGRAGYSGRGRCTCGRNTKFDNEFGKDGPAIAPID